MRGAAFCVYKENAYMTVNKVEKIIWQEIRKRDITFYDMIGLPNHAVDPNPDDKYSENMNTRRNRFTEMLGSERMKEILCQGDYHSYDDYPPLKVSLQDLFAFWWSMVIDQGEFVEQLLEEIYDYFMEQMRPPVKEPETMDMSLDFEDALQAQITDLNKERIKRKGYG
jgi:hypothetical protein